MLHISKVIFMVSIDLISNFYYLRSLKMGKVFLIKKRVVPKLGFLNI